jgi:hypothetical protein
MALQQRRQTFQFGPVAGACSVARGQELLVGRQREGQGGCQKQGDEDEQDRLSGTS